jgi:hypothetical protein
MISAPRAAASSSDDSMEMMYVIHRQLLTVRVR